MPTNNCSKTGVYQWRNLRNQKVYVGSAAVSLKGRKKTHRGFLILGKHTNRHLQGAWKKYGEDAFVFEVLEHCEPERCIEREQHWIDILKAADQEHGYNLAPKAGSNRGMKLSEAHKAALHVKGLKMPPQVAEALRLANTGAKRSLESRARMSAAHKGKPIPLETRLKMSATKRGKAKTPEHCAKLSASQKGRKFTDEHKAKLSAAAKRRCQRKAQQRLQQESGNES